MLAGSLLPGYPDTKKKKEKERNLQTFVPVAAERAASARSVCSSLTDAGAGIGGAIDIDGRRAWRGIELLAMNDEEITIPPRKTCPCHPPYAF